MPDLMQHIQAFCQWLNDTAWSTYIREGDYPFPIIETFHVIGLALSVGIVMWLDLRFLNLVWKDEPIAAAVKELEPWAMGGFVIMFISGLLLFTAEPMKCFTTISFRIIFVLLILTGLNLLYFHKILRPRLPEYDRSPTPPWQLKTVGLISFVFWFGIIIAGRWTAYI